jgi:hypothetical protein
MSWYTQKKKKQMNANHIQEGHILKRAKFRTKDDIRSFAAAYISYDDDEYIAIAIPLIPVCRPSLV